MKRILLLLNIIVVAVVAMAQPRTATTDDDGEDKKPKQTSAERKKNEAILQKPAYAWTIEENLGTRYKSTIDTLMLNYYQQAIPQMTMPFYATVGNYGGEGQSRIYFDRPNGDVFFFKNTLKPFIHDASTQKFYNSRIPMTFLSWNNAGSKRNAQDRLQATLSGNVNKKLEVGGGVDLLYSYGSYEHQAVKDFAWRLFGSYIGDKYEAQVFFNSYNLLNQENGGITNDLYITDPAEVQGGETKINSKDIPVNLDASFSRVRGSQFFANQRYKMGFWKKENLPGDTTEIETFVPVTSFIWTLDYKSNEHRFVNDNVQQDTTFFKNTYLSHEGSDDRTKYWSLRNTVGISLLEGFHKYAKFGLAAYGTYELRHYTQYTDSLTYDKSAIPVGMTLPPNVNIKNKNSESLVWVGAQLIKHNGHLINYDVDAKFGLLGSVVGDVDISGRISTKFKLGRDSVSIEGKGYFKNTESPYLLKKYISNHFIWDNDFGKERRYRVEGTLDFPLSWTNLSVGVENIQNHIYFGNDQSPIQSGNNVQIFFARIKQSAHFKSFNLDVAATYQTTSDANVIPVPALSLYGNLYFMVHIAKVLQLQLGVDCSYFTRYYAESYNPALMSFYTQQNVKVGNYPLMNVYANMKLKKVRFYVMMTHVNQGMFGGAEYFSLPHYPFNPRRFQMGISIDFPN